MAVIQTNHGTSPEPFVCCGGPDSSASTLVNKCGWEQRPAGGTGYETAVLLIEQVLLPGHPCCTTSHGLIFPSGQRASLADGEAASSCAEMEAVSGSCMGICRLPASLDRAVIRLSSSAEGG